MFPGQKGEFPGEATCIKAYMSFARGEPDAAGEQKGPLSSLSHLTLNVFLMLFQAFLRASS